MVRSSRVSAIVVVERGETEGWSTRTSSSIRPCSAKLGTLGRDDEGRPSGMKITPIRSMVSYRTERWKDAGTSWTSDRPSDAFVAEHPLLKSTIRQSICFDRA